MFKIQATCGFHKGKVRGQNEDNFYFNDQFLTKKGGDAQGLLCHTFYLHKPRYLAVFDGMGGEKFGADASYLAASAMQEVLQSARSTPAQKVLEAICSLANEKIYTMANERAQGRSGATANLICVQKKTLTAANIGDSKTFLFRDGVISQLSVDHTDAAILQQLGIQGRRPRLTQHLGIEPAEMQIEPHYTQVALKAHDKILLCSDGLTDMLPLGQITEILAKKATAKSTVQKLVQQAVLNGDKDNITVLLCQF